MLNPHCKGKRRIDIKCCHLNSDPVISWSSDNWGILSWSRHRLKSFDMIGNHLDLNQFLQHLLFYLLELELLWFFSLWRIFQRLSHFCQWCQRITIINLKFNIISQRCKIRIPQRNFQVANIWFNIFWGEAEHRPELPWAAPDCYQQTWCHPHTQTD